MTNTNNSIMIGLCMNNHKTVHFTCYTWTKTKFKYAKKNYFAVFFKILHPMSSVLFSITHSLRPPTSNFWRKLMIRYLWNFVFMWYTVSLDRCLYQNNLCDIKVNNDKIVNVWSTNMILWFISIPSTYLFVPLSKHETRCLYKICNLSI